MDPRRSALYLFCGKRIAVALGALVGRSEYQLEVLRDVTPEAVGRGARYIDEKRVCISLKEDISEKLYIEVEASAGERRAVAVIAGLCAPPFGTGCISVECGTDRVSASRCCFQRDREKIV